MRIHSRALICPHMKKRSIFQVKKSPKHTPMGYENNIKAKGRRQKGGSFGWCASQTGRGGGWGLGSDHNFCSKNYHLLFLLPFNPETSKTCKNTKPLFDSFCPSYLRVIKDRPKSLPQPKVRSLTTISFGVGGVQNYLFY